MNIKLYSTVGWLEKVILLISYFLYVEERKAAGWEIRRYCFIKWYMQGKYVDHIARCIFVAIHACLQMASKYSTVNTQNCCNERRLLKSDIRWYTPLLQSANSKRQICIDNQTVFCHNQK